MHGDLPDRQPGADFLSGSGALGRPNRRIRLGRHSARPGRRLAAGPRDHRRIHPAFAFTDSASGALSYTSNGLNQYTNVGGVVHCHDARGNLSDDGDHVFQYDSENKLTVKRLRTLAAGTCPTPATGYGGTVRASLSHDPLDRLYQASGGGEIVRMAYDGLDLIAEYDSSNGLLRRYVHGPGMDEPLVWYEGSGLSDRRWLHADERGSIVKATTGTGATLFTNSYDEYGVPGAANQGRFQYTGQLWIRGLEMYHYKARTYAPALGRFL